MQGVLSNQVPAKTRFLEMVFPEQSNHYGTLFGGTALSLMGKAAFVAASRHARRAVVMAGTERVDFHMPVKVGQVVELIAQVVRTGRTSMTVVVEMIAETLLSGQRTLAMRGRFEMVALDANGRPTEIGADRLHSPTEEVAS
jgi:acyl-CoA hydrolase